MRITNVFNAKNQNALPDTALTPYAMDAKNMDI